MAASLSESAGPDLLGKLAESITRTATVEPGGRVIDDIDTAAWTEQAERRRDVRHPADVTIERLQTHLIRWADLFTSKELAAVSLVIRALGAIERGER